MPELPEVETVRRALSDLVVNKTIREIEVINPRFLKNVDENEFIKSLTNQTFENIRRKGKYLLLDTQKYTIISHLRMEGRYRYSDVIEPKQKHDYIIFYFTDDSMLAYNDSRMFGTIELVSKENEESLKSINKLGYEPFDERLTVNYLKEKAQKKHLAIKQFLLDQTIILGIGNIYADEILFKAKIHPQTPVNLISMKEWKIILEASKKIMKRAIELGGTTIHSFLCTGDVSGRFQNELYVYGRNKEKCYVCGSTIEKIKLGGRGTHFCPQCQKLK